MVVSLDNCLGDSPLNLLVFHVKYNAVLDVGFRTLLL